MLHFCMHMKRKIVCACVNSKQQCRVLRRHMAMGQNHVVFYKQSAFCWDIDLHIAWMLGNDPYPCIFFEFPSGFRAPVSRLGAPLFTGIALSMQSAVNGDEHVMLRVLGQWLRQWLRVAEIKIAIKPENTNEETMHLLLIKSYQQ